MYGEAEKDQRNLARLDHELRGYYREMRKAKRDLNEIDELNAKSIGTRQSPALHFKGAEIEGLLPFIRDQLTSFQHLDKASIWLAAANALCAFRDLLQKVPHRPAVGDVQVPHAKNPFSEPSP